MGAVVTSGEGERVVVQVSAAVLERAEPGSILVLQVPDDCSMEVAVQVQEAVAAAIPDTTALVLAGVHFVGVVGPDGVPSVVRRLAERLGPAAEGAEGGSEGRHSAGSGSVERGSQAAGDGAERLRRWAATDLLGQLRCGDGVSAASLLQALSLGSTEAPDPAAGEFHQGVRVEPDLPTVDPATTHPSHEAG